ncbi:MAG: TolC family protein [Halobacteriovoraceae bacterium]|nr:TolC family protein [Halobacteriovoraceae bacterium]
MKYIVSFMLSAFELSILAISFDHAVTKIKSHNQIQIKEFESEVISGKAKSMGSWGDPVFKVSARNYPVDDIRDDVTPMTGLEFSLSQKIAFTNRYGVQKKAYELREQAVRQEKKYKIQYLIARLWELLIEKDRLQNDYKIYKENLDWISKMLSVTKRLYSNGVTSQQSLLEIQVRKSEIDSSIRSVRYDIDAIDEQLAYLVGEKVKITNIPWALLEKKTYQTDHKEKSLKYMADSSRENYKSSRLNLMPDATVSVGYVKRSDIDNNGDFIGASIAIPLPLSSKRYGEKKAAYNEQSRSEYNLRDYKNEKDSTEKSLNYKIDKFRSELNILNNQSIKYAENSRTITSKSYGLGEASYIELLQSEIKLQTLKLKSNTLQSLKRIARVKLKLLRGEYLYE